MLSLILKQIELFRTLDHHSLERIWGAGTQLDVVRGEWIFREDEDANELFAIVSGRVDVEMTLPGGAGSEVIATLKAGEVFGERSLAGSDRRSASARARDDCHLICWRADDILAIVKERPESGFQLMTRVATIMAARLESTSLALRNELAKQALASVAASC